MIYFYISLITYFCFLFLKTFKGIKVLSDNKFNLKKYNKWICTKDNFINIELLAIALIIIVFNTNVKVAEICMIIFYTLLFLNLLRDKKMNLRLSSKVIWAFVVTFAIYTIFFVMFYVDYMRVYSNMLLIDNTGFYYLITIILGYLAYYIVFISGYFVNLGYVLYKNSKKRKK